MAEVAANKVAALNEVAEVEAVPNEVAEVAPTRWRWRKRWRQQRGGSPRRWWWRIRWRTLIWEVGGRLATQQCRRGDVRWWCRRI